MDDRTRMDDLTRMDDPTRVDDLTGMDGSPPRRRRLLGLALLVIVLIIWFGTLGLRTLVPSDEGRYAEIAREMVASGDWVTIRYNDLKYFEKPPLHLWASATAFEWFGIGAWQARLGGALTALLGVIALAWAARRWYGPRTGWLVAALLVASPLWDHAAHFNSLDITVAGWLSCALACFLLAFHPLAGPRGERGWMLACWAAMALAMLAKGLIGPVLPALALIGYCLVCGQWRLLTRLHWRSGLALFIAIAAPWFVLVSLRNPEFAHFFFIHEHWQRFTTTVHHRSGPVWYFVPIVALGCLPWTLMAVLAIGQGRRVPAAGSAIEAGPGQASDARRLHPGLLAACWAVSIFAFFSLSSSKLPGYILPVLPALALLLAPLAERLSPRRWQTLLVLVGLGALVLALAAAPLEARLLARPAFSDLPPGRWRWLSAAGVLILAGALLASRLAARHRRFDSVLALALTVFAANGLTMMAYEPIGRARAGIDLVAPMRAALKPDTPLYAVRLLDHTLPFYLERTMTMVERPDELAFGVAREPDRWLPTLNDFIERWTRGPYAMAVLTPRGRDELAARGVPMIEIAASPRRVIVVNRAPD